jgi:hypothetical protein
MSSHYSSMHIHGVRIVIVGPGAAHNFHEKAKKIPSWTDIATVVCTRGLRTSGKVRVEYDDETIHGRVEWCGQRSGHARRMARRTRTTPRANGPRTWPKRSKWSAHVAKAGIEFRRHMESPSLPAGTPTPPSTPPITHLKTDVSDVPICTQETDTSARPDGAGAFVASDNYASV